MSAHKHIYAFDIETGPADDETLGRIMPKFDPPSNYKDPEKIAENIAGQQLAWRNKAALSAISGVIIAIGWQDDKGQNTIWSGEDEANTIHRFFCDYLASGQPDWVGHNIFGFDVPYLVRRSWVHGIRIPETFKDAIGKGYGYRRGNLIDTMQLWTCGNREDRISLDNLAKLLKVGAKTGDGAFFAETFKKDQSAALDYLRNDLAMTRAVAERLLT